MLFASTEYDASNSPIRAPHGDAGVKRPGFVLSAAGTVGAATTVRYDGAMYSDIDKDAPTARMGTDAELAVNGTKELKLAFSAGKATAPLAAAAGNLLPADGSQFVSLSLDLADPSSVQTLKPCTSFELSMKTPRQGPRCVLHIAAFRTRNYDFRWAMRNVFAILRKD